MICPHCSFDNPKGRKYCRGCAKPLAPEPPPPPPPLIVVESVEPKNSKKAIASLALSFLAFFLPLGIAAITLGHISRSEIAKSTGHLKGTALAFAALIIAYLQVLAVFLIIVPLMMSIWKSSHAPDESPHDSIARAALVEMLLMGRSDKEPDAKQAEALQEHLLAAFQVIRYREHEYASRNATQRYTCKVHELGLETGELELRERLSGYDIRCADHEDTYIVTAVPRRHELIDLPLYCMDSSENIWRYPKNYTFDRFWQKADCPTDGQRIE